MTNAEAVIRDYQVSYTYESPKKVLESKSYIITILNSKGDDISFVNEYYDKFKKIKSLKINVYNKFGKRITKVKKSDINDVSRISGYSLFDDSRAKYVRILENTYPYTIEVTMEAEYSSLIVFPTFQPYYDDDISVENASYTIIAPSDLEIRRKQFNYDFNEQVKEEGGLKHYNWSFNNFPIIKKEPYSPNPFRFIPMLLASPIEFYYDGHEGKIDNWDSYGDWVFELLEGRDDIGEKSIAEIKALTKNVDDIYEKISIAYTYMQNKTRYVSVQLGIGGFQPFPASTVENLGYGDCKALTNYMKSILDILNIKSYYTEIGAGEKGTLFSRDFASLSFTNHVILCVPNNSDTIWLECTNPYYPAGFIGQGDHDRDVVVVTEEGGVIARTKRYNRSENTQIRSGKMLLDKDGNVSCELKTSFKGLQYGDNYYVFFKSEKDQREYLSQWVPFPNFSDLKFKYENKKSRNPELLEDVSFSARNFASKSGNRMMFPVNAFNKRSSIPEKLLERKLDVELYYPYEDIDSISISLPENYEIEYLPANDSIVSEFGSYHMSVSANENEVLYVRNIKMNDGVFPKEKYEELRKFFKSISKKDNSKVVLKEKY